ncbi:tetraspanin-8-like [Selaginella moellendorffii]|uniref:tetraspanin-8-like n=1 Tax=Selaginella moellendorffii TaxID=88036 RepID=UPI000D1CEE14|nr:tetraspanin-8-like [Selaginella moellendorffii]|eukprot:XP_024521507.1 tetraspanin-8-like [Selaginella moellendorffii]
MGASNYITAIISVFTLLLSLPVIATGIWLLASANSHCVQSLQWSVLAIGILLLLLSIAGFIGGCFKVPWLLWIYLFLLSILILLLLADTIFTMVVSSGTRHGRALPGKGFREYSLGDYSPWLRKRVGGAKQWRKIEGCLKDLDVCRDLAMAYPTIQSFDAARLSPVESGCCKPPLECDLVFRNATSWDPPSRGRSSGSNPDCARWSNDPTRLCFDCDSCKAGVVEQDIRGDWKTAAIVNIVVVAVLVLVYVVACRAFRNAKRLHVEKHVGTAT